MIDPALAAPFGQRLGRIHAEAIESGVVALGAELRMLEPVCREFGDAIRHVFAAEHAEPKHLPRRELRLEARVEVAATTRRQDVGVALLHQIMHDHARVPGGP